MVNRIYTFVKNEELLLTTWLDHHLTIVPGWAIHIVDNDSTDKTTQILDQYKHDHGIHIYKYSDYKQKGNVMTEMISRYKKQPGLSIPLDCDEFVILFKDGKVIKSGDAISDYLSSLELNYGHYKTKGSLNSIPEQTKYKDPLKEIDKFYWEWTSPEMCKKFYSNETFSKTDHGNHHSGNKNMRSATTDIAYLHYHDIGFDDLKRRCELNIKGLGCDISSIKADTRETFIGVDRCKEFLTLDRSNYKPVQKWDVTFSWNSND